MNLSESTLNSRGNLQIQSDTDSDENGRTHNRLIQLVFDIVVILIILIIFGIVYLTVEPRVRYMTCADNDIFFPFIKDTVPFWAVGLFGVFGPVLTIIFVELNNFKMYPCQADSKRRSMRRFLICTFHALSLFVLGASMSVLLTDIGKRWVGRLRPHFISVCKPDWSLVNCTTKTLNGQVYNAISTGGSFCTGVASQVKEARFSFPSGHSSFAWYTMIFIIVYLEARLDLLRLRYIKPLIQMTAFIAAFVTCLSRISDYHHRGSDVIGGTVLGVTIALFITLIIGRVLWDYEPKKRCSDFDLKEKKCQL